MIRVPLEIQELKGNYLRTTNRDELLSPNVIVQTKKEIKPTLLNSQIEEALH